MIVLHILWILLKIIGILLLILLGIVFLTLLLLLFCPVRYGARGYKEGKDYGGILKVSWLWHLISLRFWYDSQVGRPEYAVRLFGISLKKWLAFLDKRRRKKAAKDQTLSDEGAEGEVIALERKEEQVQVEDRQDAVASLREGPDKPLGGERQDPDENVLLDSRQKEKRKPGERSAEILRKVGRSWRSFSQLPGRVWKALTNFKLTLEKMCDKIGKIRDFLETQEFQRGKDLILRESRRLLKKVMPRKLEGHIAFGTGDPCLTGEILAVAGIFYPVYGENLTIEPYFDQKISEGWLSFKGRIRGIHFLLTALRLIGSSDIRYIIKHFKHH